MGFKLRQFIRDHGSEVALGNIKLDQLPQEVPDFHDDSRNIHPGDVFFACSGQGYRGETYVKDALGRGAHYCVVPNKYRNENGPVDRLIYTQNVNNLFALAAREHFGRPDLDLTLIGVTGTNGKSSVAHLVRTLLLRYGEIQVACIGTLGMFVNEQRVSNLKNTTPTAKTFYAILKQLLKQGIKVVVCEISSHGIQLGRIHGCEFKSLAFLNLSRDHLDFHKDMETYFDVKTKLFSYKHEHRWINVSTNWGGALAKKLGADISIVKGKSQPEKSSQEPTSIKSIRATASSMQGAYVNIRFELFQKKSEKRQFQAICEKGLALFPENVGMAIGIVSDCCELPKTIHLSDFHLPGRYEVHQGKSGQWIMIDYAHSPDALAALLKGVRRLFQDGKLILVFGCGGDRDPGKRSLMGRVASEYADECILTNDNPRTEDPKKIIDQIKKGIIENKTTTILDREEAILLALKKAAKDDIVVIAGKGHEEVQIVGHEQHPFSDLGICRPFLVNTHHLS